MRPARGRPMKATAVRRVSVVPVIGPPGWKKEVYKAVSRAERRGTGEHVLAESGEQRQRPLRWLRVAVGSWGAHRQFEAPTADGRVVALLLVQLGQPRTSRRTTSPGGQPVGAHAIDAVLPRQDTCGPMQWLTVRGEPLGHGRLDRVPPRSVVFRHVRNLPTHRCAWGSGLHLAGTRLTSLRHFTREGVPPVGVTMTLARRAGPSVFSDRTKWWVQFELRHAYPRKMWANMG